VRHCRASFIIWVDWLSEALMAPLTVVETKMAKAPTKMVITAYSKALISMLLIHRVFQVDLMPIVHALGDWLALCIDLTNLVQLDKESLRHQ